MNNCKILIFIFISFFSVIVAFAQSESIQKVPQGMEMIEISGEGSGQLIVPKGAKTRRVGAQIIVEGTKEYMSRRFYEMEERIVKLEQNQEELNQEIRELNEIIKTTQEKH